MAAFQYEFGKDIHAYIHMYTYVCTNFEKHSYSISIQFKTGKDYNFLYEFFEIRT